MDFSDNAEVLGLVESRMGIIAVLNEECVRPRGGDLSFVSKVIISCLVFLRIFDCCKTDSFGLQRTARGARRKTRLTSKKEQNRRTNFTNSATATTSNTTPTITIMIMIVSLLMHVVR